jgi:hypothetical protein
MPERVYAVVPEILVEIAESDEDTRNRIAASRVLVQMEGQRIGAEEKAGTTNNVNVTVNQHAEGGIIENKAAVDAAAAWLAAMANDAGDSGGAGVVCDAGSVPSPKTLGSPEQETH